MIIPLTNMFSHPTSSYNNLHIGPYFTMCNTAVTANYIGHVIFEITRR